MPFLHSGTQQNGKIDYFLDFLSCQKSVNVFFLFFKVRFAVFHQLCVGLALHYYNERAIKKDFSGGQWSLKSSVSGQKLSKRGRSNYY